MVKQKIASALFPLTTALGVYIWIDLQGKIPAPVLLFFSSVIACLILFFPARWSLKGFPIHLLLGTLVTALAISLALGAVLMVGPEKLAPSRAWSFALAIPLLVTAWFPDRKRNVVIRIGLTLGALWAVLSVGFVGWKIMMPLFLSGLGFSFIIVPITLFQGDSYRKSPPLGRTFLVFAWMVILSWGWGLFKPIEGAVDSSILAVYTMDQNTWVLLALVSVLILAVPVGFFQKILDSTSRLGALWFLGLVLGLVLSQIRSQVEPFDLLPYLGLFLGGILLVKFPGEKKKENPLG